MKKILKIDNEAMRGMTEKAVRFYTTSDERAWAELFGQCESVEEINSVAEDLYEEFFEEDREDLFEADGIAVYAENGLVHEVDDANDFVTIDTPANREKAVEDARATVEAWKR